MFLFCICFYILHIQVLQPSRHKRARYSVVILDTRFNWVITQCDSASRISPERPQITPDNTRSIQNHAFGSYFLYWALPNKISSLPPTWVKFPIRTGTWVLQYSIPSTRIRMGILTKQKVESSSITRLMIIDSKKQPSSHLEYVQLFPPHFSRKNCKKDAVADALNKFLIHLNTRHLTIFQEKLAFF